MQVNYDARKVVHRIHDVPDVIIGYRCFPRIFLVRNSSSIFFKNNTYPEKNLASKYTLKMNKRHTRTRCELWQARKISEWCNWHCLAVFTAYFEYTSHVVLVFLLLTLTSVEQYIWLEEKIGVASFSIWKRSFIKRQTSDTSSDNERQRVVQQVTTNEVRWLFRRISFFFERETCK